MPEKILLADGNNIMHRSYHALPPMNNGDGVPTNAISGFLQTFFRALQEEKPEYAAIAFDLHGPTFRHEKFPEYKGQRPPTPEDLRPQFDWVKRALEAMGVAMLSLEGYEADDMLGTAALAFTQKGMEAVLLTGDKDAFQLVGGGARVAYLSGKGDTERVDEEYLQKRYGLTPDKIVDLKGLMGDSSDNIPGVPGVGEKTALKLLDKYGSLEGVLRGADAGEKGALREKLTTYADLARLSREIATIDRHAPVEIDEEKLRLRDMRGGKKVLDYLELRRVAARLEEVSPAPAENAAQAEEPPSMVLPDIETARTWAEARASGNGRAAVAVTDSVSVADEADGAYLPLGGDLLNPGASEEEALAALAPFYAFRRDAAIYDVKKWKNQGRKIPQDAFDVMLAAYCIDPQEKSFQLPALLEGEAGDTAARRMLALSIKQKDRIGRDGLNRVYYDIERPLAGVLSDMEKEGFAVDAEELARLGGIYAGKMEEYLALVRAVAGDVNVNSPKQLGALLFEKLGLPSGKKTRTGYSTDAGTLEGLLDKDETGVVRAVLEYRKYAKLKSTYIDALMRLRGADGRIHTSFDQTATATGRISSSEPNLQNIPVRTEIGKDIRRAFVARDGWVLVDADYSQIELRVLAHMSGDEVMTDAFLKGQDIHRRTAAEVYGVALEDVTGAMRSAAKAVNFGIVYGISDFGLARNIGVSKREAGEFIARYLERYPGIRAYMEKQVDLGRRLGYAETMFGRRRYLPEMNSPSHTVRAFGERCAMNSPIQGTAADIIKLAMIAVDDALRERGLRARLILQVHDELIVEAPPEEADAARDILKECMENVAALNAPLRVEISQGGNWYACK